MHTVLYTVKIEHVDLNSIGYPDDCTTPLAHAQYDADMFNSREMILEELIDGHNAEIVNVEVIAE